MEQAFWDYQGVLLPRGCVVESVATPSDLAALEVASSARGVRAALNAPKPARATRQKDSVASLARWAAELGGFDCCGVVTYTDAKAASLHLHSLGAACRDVARNLQYAVPITGCKVPGYAGPFCLSGEWHRTDREWPHVHLLLNSLGRPKDAFCSDMWRYFFRNSGRSWFKGFDDLTEDEAALFYHLKDTVKGASLPADPDAFWLKLSMRHRRGRRSRGRTQPYGGPAFS